MLSADKQRLLVFRLADGGIALLSGNVKAGEFPAVGGLRALEFEAGLTGKVKRPLGVADNIVIGEIWYFFLCSAKASESDFSLRSREADAQHLQPGWWMLSDAPGSSWSPAHSRAYSFIIQSLGSQLNG